MRERAPYYADDLAEFGALLDEADQVVALRDANPTASNEIALRHDVDNTFDGCVRLAEWEAERGYRSTWFVQHDVPYWGTAPFVRGLDRIAELGHEVGLHNNAITVALTTGRHPFCVITEALADLIRWGHDPTGVVGHGDGLCHAVGYVNDELFTETPYPDWGEPDRTLEHDGRSYTLAPAPLAEFGLIYNATAVGARTAYLSDSGRVWTPAFEDAHAQFADVGGRLQILQHPCWWIAATVAVIA